MNTNSVDFAASLSEAFNGLASALNSVDGSFLTDEFLPGLLEFAGFFLVVWGTWVGIRAILRSGRLVK